LFLVLGGLLLVGSSTSYVALREWQDPSTLFLRRAIHTAIAILAFGIALKLPYQRLAERKWLQTLFWVCLGLLVLVFFMPAQNGAHRWIILGPLRLQPSELTKLFVVVYVAFRLSRRQRSINDLSETVRPCVLIVGTLALLVLAEPDLGSAAVLVAVPAAMIFAAGLHWKYLFRAGALATAGIAAALIVVPYRLVRVREFIEWVLGISPAPYQLEQSLIAVGSGGLLGRGPGESIQKAFFLPASHTDFIYSILGEELGMLGALVLLLAFLLLFLRGIRTTTRTHDPFGSFLALGLTCLIVGQGLLHMAVCLGMLPTTGLTLPLISYGGSSLVISMAALGLLVNVSQYRNLTRPRREVVQWNWIQTQFSWRGQTEFRLPGYGRRDQATGG
jgi:cell division protein FtsW